MIDIFKNSVPISKKQCIPITKISRLALFRNIIALYSEDNTNPINKHCWKDEELLAAKWAV
jgi:hypothetical protein